MRHEWTLESLQDTHLQQTQENLWHESSSEMTDLQDTGTGAAERLWIESDARPRRHTLYDQQGSYPIRDSPGETHLGKNRPLGQRPHTRLKIEWSTG